MRARVYLREEKVHIVQEQKVSRKRRVIIVREKKKSVGKSGIEGV